MLNQGCTVPGWYDRRNRLHYFVIDWLQLKS
jgi:hypothetical protein